MTQPRLRCAFTNRQSERHNSVRVAESMIKAYHPTRLVIATLFVLGCASRAPVLAEDPAEKASDPFAFRWRVIEPWMSPEGTEFFSHGGSILTWQDMEHPRPSSPLARFVDQVRCWGFNAIGLYCDPDVNPRAVRRFAAYLKERGIGLLLRRDWNEIETGKSWPVSQSDARPRSSPKLSPYRDEVCTYWRERIRRDYEMIPDLLGYRMNGTEFYFANGAPWMGEGPMCKTKTGRERTRDAVRLIAGLLAEHGGTLFWETCQDDPAGQRQELHYFRDMTGKIPENAFIVIKRYYWDFHPRWPRHPLYDTITKDARGQSVYITSLQQAGEYQGVHDFPWCMVDEWSGAFEDMTATGQQGVWVMAIVHRRHWDHPLNMVNWHAIARYMRDPLADPSEIKLGWARETFGSRSAPVVVEVLHKVTEAARGMYEFDALWTANHSRFPTLEYLDSHLCGPYRQTKRMAKMMGLLLPLDMYAPQRAAEIRVNPQTRMVFNQVAITQELKDEAMAQKQAATRLVDEAIALWRTLKGKIDDEPYRQILGGLEANRNDTVIFAHMMGLYMDWKLGVLTDAKIDASLEACRGLKGAVVPDPLDPDPKKVTIVKAASLKTFAEQLRRDLHEPWVEDYWCRHQLGAGVTDPIDYEHRAEEASPSSESLE